MLTVTGTFRCHAKRPPMGQVSCPHENTILSSSATAAIFQCLKRQDYSKTKLLLDLRVSRKNRFNVEKVFEKMMDQKEAPFMQLFKVNIINNLSHN
jgi:hypothetical protein